ncbi:MAG: phosphoribosylformylglycinamidine synthase subunit PurQ [Actinomycetes bacterium]|jgi:phosphoribosylformylglycinamidine synthase|nr:phosphoribosylformylglycinamidine synthase subunit PurQ [Actinomycetes bacterium]
MKLGTIVFPGSNCEQDVAYACEYLGIEHRYLWHNDRDLGGVDAVVLPGGFSYGDYLRCGAVARFSPIMDAVSAFAADGGRVLGICNGFQVLTEAHLLPGALIRNTGLKFICRELPLRVQASCAWLNEPAGRVLRMPVAHNEGNFVCDDETLAALQATDRIILRYCADDGGDLACAPNGARDCIAGICNEGRNVFGLMPHPERVIDPVCGGIDGQTIFRAVAGLTGTDAAAAAAAA